MVRFSEKELKTLLGETANKYNNSKSVFDGRTFDSEHERDRYAELKLLEKTGKITDLKLQPRFELVPAVKENGKTTQRAVTYKADFSYIENGELVVEDAKGVKTEVYKLKKKLMRAILGINVKEV